LIRYTLHEAVHLFVVRLTEAEDAPPVKAPTKGEKARRRVLRRGSWTTRAWSRAPLESLAARR
jgi:hypothetical protein